MSEFDRFECISVDKFNEQTIKVFILDKATGKIEIKETPRIINNNE